MVLVLGHSNHGAWQDLLRPQCLKELRRLVDATDVTCSEKAAENKSWWAFLNSWRPFTGKYILFLSSFHDPTSVPQNNVSGRQWSAPWNPPRRFWCSPAAGASPVEPQRVSPAPCSRMGCHSLEPRMSVDGQDYADEAGSGTPNNQNIQKDPESYMVETCCFWLMVMKITQGTTIWYYYISPNITELYHDSLWFFGDPGGCLCWTC